MNKKIVENNQIRSAKHESSKHKIELVVDQNMQKKKKFNLTNKILSGHGMH
jgi:hypothetical protein